MGVNPDDQPLWRVFCDQQITRRKWYFIVTDPTGAVSFSSRKLTDCIDHLEAHEQEEALLELLDGQNWAIRRLGVSNQED